MNTSFDHSRQVGPLETGQNVMLQQQCENGKVLSPYLKKTSECGNVLKKHTVGHKRTRTPLEERYVSLVGKSRRNATPRQIVADYTNVTALAYLREPFLSD